jgi:hypothetical protein
VALDNKIRFCGWQETLLELNEYFAECTQYELVRLIKLCLSETYSRVRVGKNFSDSLPIRNGLKQGDALSLRTSGG